SFAVAVSIFITLVAMSGAIMLYVMARSGKGLAEIAEEELLADADCPIYTVLSAVRGEAEVVGQLARHLSTMNYPKDKLQVIIIVDEGDDVTISALSQMVLPHFMEWVIAPKNAHGPEKGKP